MHFQMLAIPEPCQSEGCYFTFLPTLKPYQVRDTRLHLTPITSIPKLPPFQTSHTTVHLEDSRAPPASLQKHGLNFNRPFQATCRKWELGVKAQAKSLLLLNGHTKGPRGLQSFLNVCIYHIFSLRILHQLCSQS